MQKKILVIALCLLAVVFLTVACNKNKEQDNDYVPIFRKRSSKLPMNRQAARIRQMKTPMTSRRIIRKIQTAAYRSAIRTFRTEMLSLSGDKSVYVLPDFCLTTAYLFSIISPCKAFRFTGLLYRKGKGALWQRMLKLPFCWIFTAKC